MSNKYPVLLKGFLVVLALTIWMNNGFPVREGNSTNSPANEPTIPEYSYGLGYIPLEGEEESILPLFKTYPAPPSWDWRSATYNSVTGDWTTIAKSQGGCGSCWDFAAHGALEAIINVRSSNPNLDLDLSEQYILSCYSGGWGCMGSNAYYAYGYMDNNGGAIPETCFPYYADDDIPCSDKCSNWQDLLVPISDYGYSSFPSRNAIKDMIYEHGPVCLAFRVYADFYTGSPSFDENGVYQYDDVSEYRGGHQIVAIGYEDTPGHPDYDGYWICKNSWGATWGPWNDGCFGIAYGECDIETGLVYVDYDKPDESFVRGDYDGDGQILTNDALMEFQYIFEVPGYTPPSCEDAADYDDDGDISTNDPLMMLHFIFEVPGYVPPPLPGEYCGPDPTPDDLYCVWHEFCMGGKVLAYKPSVSAPDAVDKLVVGEVTPVDGAVRVPVDLTISEPVCGFDIEVGYDATLLRFMKVDGGEGYDFYAVDTRQDGVVRIGGVPDIEMAELMGAGTHRVGEILFTVERKADVALNWRNVEVYGSNVEPLFVEWVNGVVKVGTGLPTEFALSQNYPNPFNPTTLIKYDLPVDCQVRLDIYNVVGQRVATLVDGQQKTGYKVVSWNASTNVSGIYFCRFSAGSFRSVKKMVLLK